MEALSPLQECLFWLEQLSLADCYRPYPHFPPPFIPNAQKIAVGKMLHCFFAVVSVKKNICWHECCCWEMNFCASTHKPFSLAPPERGCPKFCSLQTRGTWLPRGMSSCWLEIPAPRGSAGLCSEESPVPSRQLLAWGKRTKLRWSEAVKSLGSEFPSVNILLPVYAFMQLDLLEVKPTVY